MTRRVPSRGNGCGYHGQFVACWPSKRNCPESAPAVIDLRPEARLSMTRGPMTLASNGEVENFAAERQQLEDLGQVFTTGGDAEVIIALYRHQRETFTDHREGMYPGALWDGDRRRLLLGRDPAGKKPL